MKVLSYENKDNCETLIVRQRVLFIPWTFTYKRRAGEIFRFVAPNKYYKLGIIEYFEMRDLFNYHKSI